MSNPYSRQEWQRLNLACQGLLDPPTDVADAVNRLGYVQIDSIHVAARAHHHVLHSRLPHYSQADLDAAQARGEIFEYWSHAAAYLPMADYRFSLQRKLALKNGDRHWFERDSQEMREVLARIRAEGPLRAADFESAKGRNNGWWDWKPAKKALEQLFMEGDLMVLRRDKFQKVYDLTERVLPAHVDCREPGEQEFAGYLIDRFLGAHGVGTVKQMAYLRRNVQAALTRELAERREQGRLQSFKADGQEHWFDPARVPPAALPDKVWLLNPFDNLIIQRERLRHWFDFDYLLEVYVPEAKRRFGYYTLAVLWQDCFIARLDVKADRDKKLLLLRQLTLEPQAYDAAGNLKPFLPALEQAVADYARFNGCERWKLELCSDKQLKSHYRRQQWLQP
ncbi:winged helix-turn-helix domain-containing protein [Shewanella cyperi]|uniref:winged helix-turn-helix domain-containing protein n=1 Tax=Shewanella cyperi TaxID=2814292 RepID=UPI001A943DBD|nr:crosslink repair DNA glycosylase YcaQ family protein [Shewanella cyperi]QSX40329.1 YcaQ family DNA glycosylase [Shewanella cyperi]